MMDASATVSDTPSADRDRRPLVVDLDGTLCHTDTLDEALLRLAVDAPLTLRHLPTWIGEGRAALKARLADRGVIPAEQLPLNDAILDLVRTARDEGRPTALVSAADHRQVTEVAHATGLFDEAYGSAEGRNLKGAEKADFLTDRYGRGGFDYVGDSLADLPVWEAARRAYTVGAGTRLRRRAETVGADVVHLAPPEGRGRAILRAMRPHQWSKNALLFLPPLAAHDFSTLGQVVLGFLAFCCAASSVYILNDLLDLSSDRAHPRKRRRPFASGELTARQGIVLAAGLFATAAGLGLATGQPLFLAVLGAYFVLTFAYSLWLKRKLLIDVLVLAGLYTMRVLAGGVAADVTVSLWMLGFSVFLFLALASVKRQAELTDQIATGRASAGRAYDIEDLPVLRSIAISASQATVLVLALYIASDDVQALYPQPVLLWPICPLLLYWTLRMVMKAHRGRMTDDPIVFAMTDRVSLLIIIAAASFMLAGAL